MFLNRENATLSKITRAAFFIATGLILLLTFKVKQMPLLTITSSLTAY